MELLHLRIRVAPEQQNILATENTTNKEKGHVMVSRGKIKHSKDIVFS